MARAESIYPGMVSVVIPVHNAWTLTEQCLRFLDQQTLPHELIVVDNASTDETLTRLAEVCPRAHAVCLTTNTGFAVACNRGVAESKGEFVVLLNNDVFANDCFLERLVSPLREDATLGSAAAVLTRPGEGVLDSAGLAMDTTLAGFARLRGRSLPLSGPDRPALLGPSGAAGAYRRAAWDDVGGMDENLFFYGEDLDIAIRLRLAGWRTTLANAALAEHIGSASARHRSSWQRYHGGFARTYLLRRYRGGRPSHLWRTVATETLVVIGDLLLSRDFAALRGRVAGWRAARAAYVKQQSVDGLADPTIGFLQSLALRREAYSAAPRSTTALAQDERA